MKTISVLLILLGFSINSHAQSYMNTLSQMQPELLPPAQLYQLNPEQYNHHLEFVLPDNGTLLIDFLRLSDWGAQNQLQEITELAAKQVQLLKDSFRNNYSDKVVALNIPINEKIISISYKEDASGKSQLANKAGTLYQLKSGSDTLRVVKNVGIRTRPRADSGLVQVQYTFILKNINAITDLAANKALIQRIGAVADEEITKRRKNWTRQDADYHTLTMKYDPDAAKPVDIQDYGTVITFIQKRIGIYLGVGLVGYTNNAVSPYFDESLAYLISSRGKMQSFVGINVTAFGYLSSNNNKAAYTSYNLEFGMAKRAPGFMQQKTSVIIGIMRPYNVDNDKSMLNFGFSFGFNTFLAGGFFVASDYKKNTHRSLVGVNFKFNL